jgi:hypothetical protein
MKLLLSLFFFFISTDRHSFRLLSFVLRLDAINSTISNEDRKCIFNFEEFIIIIFLSQQIPRRIGS